MIQNFKIKEIIKRPEIIFLSLYFFLRIFSYFFSPPTPLYAGHLINSLFSALVWCYVINLFFEKKNQRAWLIIAGEFILGGAGGFLSVNGISLRLLFLITGAIFYSKDKIILFLRTRDFSFFNSNKKTALTILGLSSAAILAAIIGYFSQNKTSLIISDFIPYLFLFYFFPLRELLTDEKFKIKTWEMIKAAIIGNAIFILLTFIGFSARLFVIQGEYYHWFRDIALGKITDMGLDFYRIVLNEHLILVPIILYFLYKKIHSRASRIDTCLLFSCLFILSINLTRIYFVALVVGTLFLFSLKKWRAWFKYSLLAALAVFLSFTIVHLSASRGQSLGWEFFGIRLQSITSPQIEDSSLSRMLILPEAWKQIKDRPVFGQGLGDEISVYSPVAKQQITTNQYDWGWLEIWAEQGFLGLLIWLGFLYLIFIKTKKSDMLAPFIALLFINITSPALFHVFGIIFLVIALSKSGKKTLSDKIVIPSAVEGSCYSENQQNR